MPVRRLALQITLILVLISGAVAWWLHREWTSPYYGAASPETFLEIPRGANLDTIATLLVEGGVLRSRHPFMLYIRWIGATRNLKAGEYRFSAPLTPPQVALKIVRGELYYLTVTIPEGLTGDETVDLFTQAGLGESAEMKKALTRVEWIRDLAPTALTLEGYLFPETYRFSRKTSSPDIIKTTVDQFRLRYGRLVAEHPIPPTLSSAQIVILASMIEKEVKTQDERPLVASVLLNRLKIGMPLACDPTIIYARKLAGSFDGNLRKADMKLDSPYNTYTRRGFPPGPIANPGADSLLAALTPARSNFLYYVARNDGTHLFSRDFAAHQAGVLRFQKKVHVRGK